MKDKYTYIVSHGVNLSHLHDTTTCRTLKCALGLAEYNWSEGKAWQVTRIDNAETKIVWNSKRQESLDLTRKRNIYRKSKGYKLLPIKESRFSLFNQESNADRKERLDTGRTVYEALTVQTYNDTLAATGLAFF
jgi:hypothetical protein